MKLSDLKWMLFHIFTLIGLVLIIIGGITLVVSFYGGQY